MFSTRKELWLNVQVAISLDTVNKQSQNDGVQYNDVTFQGHSSCNITKQTLQLRKLFKLFRCSLFKLTSLLNRKLKAKS